MTLDFRLIDRRGAGLKPARELSTEDHAAMPGWHIRGSWGMSYGGVGRYLIPWCEPILDRTTPKPEAGFAAATAEWNADDAIPDGYIDEPAHVAWRERHYAALAMPSAVSEHLIPVWKFDGDFAILTPHECWILAYHLRGAPDPDLREFGQYMALCSQHGGAEVS